MRGVGLKRNFYNYYNYRNFVRPVPGPTANNDLAV